MGSADNPPNSVHEEERYAVRRLYAEGHPRPGGDQAIALGNAGGGRLVRIDDADPLAVDLSHQDQIPVRDRKGLADDGQVAADIFLPVSHPKARVEAGKRPCAHPAAAGAEGMLHEPQRRDPSGFQILDRSPMCETEHPLPRYVLESSLLRKLTLTLSSVSRRKVQRSAMSSGRGEVNCIASPVRG